MPKKGKNNIVIKIIGVLFIVYIALFIANISGYYEGEIRNKTNITNEKIQEFEQMIQNEEVIDLESFLNDDLVDYSSKMSHLGDYITECVEGVMTNGMHVVGDIFKSLF